MPSYRTFFNNANILATESPLYVGFYNMAGTTEQVLRAMLQVPEAQLLSLTGSALRPWQAFPQKVVLTS